MTAFRFFVYTAPGSSDPALAIAASRAGAVGVFDAEGIVDESVVDAAMGRLARFAGNTWGLRLGDDHDTTWLAGVLDRSRPALGWLVVTPDGAEHYRAALTAFRKAGGQVVLEVSAWDKQAAQAGKRADAVIARGRAPGGLSDRVDLLQLLPEVAATSPLPVYAMGAVSMRTLPACFAAGAAGAVLDWQVSALAESPLRSDAAGPLAKRWAARYLNVAGALKAAYEALVSGAAALAGTEPASSQGAMSGGLVLMPQDRDPATLIAQADDNLVPLAVHDGQSGGSSALNRTAIAAGDRRWGALVDARRFTSDLGETIDSCARTGAGFVVLRDARPDQAMAVIAAKVPVHLPVQSPVVLDVFLRQGATHFVVDLADGGEASLTVWSSLVRAFAERVRDGLAGEALHVLLRVKGQEHTHAALALALAAPFASLGMRAELLTDAGANALPDADTVTRLAGRLVGLAPEQQRPTPRPADIAIVGIGVALPGATNVRQYWDNLLNRVNSIREIPADRWDWRLYYDENRQAPDKIYSRWGGFIEDLPFDPMHFGMPPKSIRAVDPMQLMALEVVRQTVEDAGYDKRDFDRDRVSVILGATGGTGDVGAQYAVRSETVRFNGSLPEDVAARLPQWTEDSFAGILLNVTAGRAANRFDFGGLNFTVDSACASSLTAICQAVDELDTGRSDMAIAGGVDTMQGPFGYLCFSKTQALSPRGQCSTFDKSADGIVISEGIAMVALKRLADAERDGDRIYAVIKGVGGSSDGRARSMTAPHPDGQVRALQRAYERAGYSPATVGLFEAHGTGTVAGDTAELETLTRVLDKADHSGRETVVGSVKTLIGHTKGTAGVAGLVKTALALYHRVQPPHANVSQPNRRIADAGSPLSLLTRARPWIAAADQPRRGSVSAFGFGGTNFHVTMEEYQGDFLPSLKPSSRPDWPAELLLWRADTPAGLAAQIRATADWLPDSAAAPRLRDLAWTLAREAPATGLTAALVATDSETLAGQLRGFADHVLDPAAPIPEHAYYSTSPLTGDGGGVAVVFAGQSAQYPDMLRQVALAFPDIPEALTRANDQIGEPVSRRVYPTGRFDENAERAARDALDRPATALVALAAVQSGMWRLFERLGVRPLMSAGHSAGECTALHAAGVLSLDDLLAISRARGEAYGAPAEPTGRYAMARIKAADETVAELVDTIDDAWIASYTVPGQVTICGTREAVGQILSRLDAPKASAIDVPVPIHTPLAQPTAGRLADVSARATFSTARFPVFRNATAAAYSPEPGPARDEFDAQLVQPVRFTDQILAMYDAGARIFLGLGPRNGPGSPIVDILGDRPHLAMQVDDGQGGLLGLLKSCAALLAEGVSLELKCLYEGRDCALLDLEGGGPERGGYPRHVWLLNGGAARPAHEPAATPLRLEQITAQRDAATTEDRELETQVPADKGTVVHREKQAMSTTAIHSLADLPAPTGDETMNLIAGDEREAILHAYQETMRHFLAAQERVMMAYLTGESRPTSVASVRPAPRRLAPARAPVAVAAPTHTPQPIAAPAPQHVAPPAPPPAAVAPPQPKTPVVAVQPTAAPVQAGRSNGVSAEPSATPARAPSSLDADGIRQQLLELVEDRTGYPRDMLDLDQNIEADLGIDSIKRVEIVGALLKVLPDSMVSGNTALSDELNGQTTLRGMIDHLSQSNGIAAASNL